MTPTTAGSFDAWFRHARQGLVEDLCHLVAIPSVTPHETLTFPWLDEQLRKLGASVTWEARHPDLESHPDVNDNVFLIMPAEDRGCLHAEIAGAPGGSRVLFSAHVDVVPAGTEFVEAFAPEVRDDAVVGRGAADTKGNIAMLLGALAYLRDQGLAPRPHVSIDFVVEEEIGGNGALSTLLHGRDVDDVVVLEPTSLEVFHGHRGCVEFALDVKGRSTHMGSSDRGFSAIDGAIDFIAALHRTESGLIARAAGDPDFASWDRPLQVNVGSIHGGEWHGSVPEACKVAGAFGFLPDLSIDDVKDLLANAKAAIPDPESADLSTFTFEGIHNDAYRGEPHTTAARGLRRAMEGLGGPSTPPRAWNVSCDARLYHHVAGLPTVVWGAGSLVDAHSSHEKLPIAELRVGMAALVDFLIQEAP